MPFQLYCLSLSISIFASDHSRIAPIVFLVEINDLYVFFLEVFLFTDNINVNGFNHDFCCDSITHFGFETLNLALAITLKFLKFLHNILHA